MQRLKSATAQLHARVEERVRFTRDDGTVDDLKLYLSAMADMHDAYDAAFLAVEGFAPRVERLEQRLQRGALARLDLAALSHQHDTGPLPGAMPTTIGAAFGALYVLEGSSLGARVLFGTAQRRFGFSSRYLCGYGRATGVMWRSLAASVDGYVNATADEDSVIDGANDCFAACLRAFA